MRYLWLPILFLLAFPAYAAEQTHTFPLRHRTAAEIDQQLVDSARLAAPGRGLVPDGISAWSVDDRRNALVVTGSAPALERLTQVLRLIDIPVPRVRLGVRPVRREEVTTRGVRTEPEQKSDIAWAVLTPAQVKALPAGPAGTVTEMTVTHNHLLHARWPSQPNPPATFVAVAPRLNDDGTVTLVLSTNGQQLEAGQAETRLPITLFRRLPVGSALVLSPHGPGEGLMIQVEDRLP
jgi:hypothetical protein